MPGNLQDLRRLLEQLGDTTQPISFSSLYALSDLAGEELSEFLDTWAGLPVDRRRHLIQALVELAEASFEVTFDSIFRHSMDDPDDIVRATAIDGLWENQEQTLIGPLLNMLLHDPSPQVRAAAASGLGRYVLAGELEQLEAAVEARIMTELLTTIHLADESIIVRRRAIESAAYACTPEVLDALESAYYDEDEEMRISAVVGMGRSCDHRWASIVLQELANHSPAMRYEAAWACGELRLHRAVPVLGRLLMDPDRQVNNAAIWALGQIGGTEAREILLDAYEDADEDTQEAIADALAEQDLLEGNLDFTLYQVDDEDGGLLDDELVVLWDPDEEESSDIDWEFDDP